jgi:serine/threonine protein kinase/tetratricopeptide (TPR) repeat protein
LNASANDAKTIFGRAIEIEDASARAAYLDQVCGANDQLRAEIDSLIGAHFKVGDFLKGPARDAATCLHDANAGDEGTVIGPYKLLEKIGEGGMGVVFMADQHAPVRRRVALNIIKPGMDTRQVLARFDAERQALALMDHPNIARALDAGATDSGRPYFVMELVRGVPITDYCDQNKLPVHERLELFVEVCRAVQHAHQKGVIHRDLKPSNILVTLFDGRPVPKVIDFGVAKAINQPLTEETLFTRFAEMVGTPLYMSPEQAEMSSLDIDTRSDIYSLGVLLYELLTGTTPFDKNRLKKAAYDEIRRIIREEEPAKPSTRISTLGDNRTVVAAHRHADPNRLSQLLRGDLDWIVMKALEKERSQRYETASGLAADVERHLANEPVLACPPSVAYRFAKFARRNRVAFAASIVVLAAILVGTAVSITQAIRATHAEHLAESRLEAEAAARAEAERASKAEAEQRQIADRQRQQAEENLKRARQAVDQYFTRVSQSKLFDEPTLLPLRKELLEDAARYYRTLLSDRGEDPALLADLAVADLRLAEINHEVDRNDDAIDTMASGLELVERLHSKFPDAKEEQRRVAGFWKANRDSRQVTVMPKDPAKTERTLMKFVSLWETLAQEHPYVVSFQNDLAAAHASLATWQNAAGRAYGSSELTKAGLDSSQKAIEIWDRLSQSHPEVPEYRESLVMVLHELAYSMEATGRHAELPAIIDRELPLCEQLVAQYPKVPQYRVRLAGSLHQRGLLLEAAGKRREAGDTYRRELELAEALVTQFPTVSDYFLLLATASRDFLRCSNESGIDSAKRSSREIASVLPLLKGLAATPNRDPTYRFALAEAFKQLAEGLHIAGDPATAVPLFQEAILLYRQLIQEDPKNLAAREQLAHTTGMTAFAFQSIPERRGDVEPAFRAAIEAFQNAKALAPNKVQSWHFLARIHAQFASWLMAHERPEEGEQELRRSVDIYDAGSKKVRLQPYHEEEWAAIYLGFANYLASKGRSQEAEEIIRRFTVQVEALISASPKRAFRREWLARAQHDLANVLNAARRMADAESHYRQAFVQYDALLAASGGKPEYRLNQAQCHRDFAWMLRGAGRTADAEAEYRQAIALLKKLIADTPANGEPRFYLAHSDCGLADLLSTNKRSQEAEDLLRQALGLFEKLASESPSQGNLRVDAGHVLWNLANLDAAAGRPTEVEKDHRRALAIFEKLAADFPQVRYYRLEQGQSDWNIAALMRQQNRLPEAEKSYRDAADVYAKMVAEVPNDGGPRIRLAQIEFDLAEVLRAESRPGEVEKHYRLAAAAWRKLAADNPKSADFQNSLGDALARLGSWDEALAAIDKAVELQPADHWFLFRAAALHLRAGDVVGYRRVCRSMLERFQVTRELQIADRTAKTCLLAADAVPDFDRVQKLADRTVDGTEKQGDYRWFLFVKGLAEYRAGRFAEAVKWLDRFGPDAHGAQIDASGFAVRAMAQHRLGQKEKARAALKSGQAIVAEKMPDPAAGRPFDGMWQDWLHSQILLREAEELLKPDHAHASQPPRMDRTAAE